MIFDILIVPSMSTTVFDDKRQRKEGSLQFVMMIFLGGIFFFLLFQFGLGGPQARDCWIVEKEVLGNTWYVKTT